MLLQEPVDSAMEGTVFWVRNCCRKKAITRRDFNGILVLEDEMIASYSQTCRIISKFERMRHYQHLNIREILYRHVLIL
jgi:hypothetical protein